MAATLDITASKNARKLIYRHNIFANAVGFLTALLISTFPLLVTIPMALAAFGSQHLAAAYFLISIGFLGCLLFAYLCSLSNRLWVYLAPQDCREKLKELVVKDGGHIIHDRQKWLQARLGGGGFSWGHELIAIYDGKNILMNIATLDNLGGRSPFGGFGCKGLIDDYALALNSARYLQEIKPDKSA